MTDHQRKILIQVVGANCSLIGDGKPAIGLAYALAMLAETPERVQKIADAAARVLEKGES